VIPIIQYPLIHHPVINVHPEIMHGTPVFMGPRVPICSLFDYLAGGYTLDEFLDHFPFVRRGQAVELLEFLKQLLVGTNEDFVG
jgi:uncharacterized protein (DUF433 family)